MKSYVISRTCFQAPAEPSRPGMVAGEHSPRPAHNLLRAIRRTFRKMRSNVAEDQRIIILSGLVATKPRIGAVRGSELVFSDIGYPGRQTEVESLNSNDI